MLSTEDFRSSTPPPTGSHRGDRQSTFLIRRGLKNGKDTLFLIDQRSSFSSASVASSNFCMTRLTCRSVSRNRF
jgi:hypothetical protein